MPLALEKVTRAKVSGHISERVNVTDDFHDVNLALYTATNIYPKTGI